MFVRLIYRLGISEHFFWLFWFSGGFRNFLFRLFRFSDGFLNFLFRLFSFYRCYLLLSLLFRRLHNYIIGIKLEYPLDNNHKISQVDFNLRATFNRYMKSDRKQIMCIKPLNFGSNEEIRQYRHQIISKDLGSIAQLERMLNDLDRFANLHQLKPGSLLRLNSLELFDCLFCGVLHLLRWRENIFFYHVRVRLKMLHLPKLFLEV